MKFYSALKKIPLHSYGFTFVEVVIVIAVTSTLFSIITLNLLNIHQVKTVQSTSEIMISDFRSQQTKAMTLSTQNSSESDNYGIFFDNNSYYLFKGSVYDPNDPSNSQVKLPDNFTFNNINLPNAQVVFEKGSGEILNYDGTQNTITIFDTNEQNSRLFQINPYGIIIYN